MSHTGSHNDEFGNMVSWWDKETLDNYLDRAKCFADQYGGYEIESGHQASYDRSKNLIKFNSSFQFPSKLKSNI